MSANAAAARSADATDSVSSSGSRAHVSGASNEPSLGVDASREREFSAGDTPPPPPPETEDEETESEVEMEMETGADHEVTPAPPADTPPRATDAELELSGAMDEPDSEEEDEAFPPVQSTPRNSGTDEETKGDENETASGRRTARRRAESDERKQEESLDEGDGNEDDNNDDDDDASYESPQRHSGGRRREKTHVEVGPDLELLQLAAAEAPRMAAAEKKMAIWNAWAQKLSHRFRSGRALQARIAWLQLVLRDPAHGEYSHLTDEMKKLMKTFNVATGSVKPPRASPKRRTIIGFTDPAKRRRTNKHSTKPSLEERLRTSESATTSKPEHAEAATLLLGAGTPLSQEGHSLDIAADEDLMREAMKLVPKFVAAEDKLDVWAQLCTASGGRFVRALQIRSHVRWLVKVAREPTHREHGQLTPALRDLISEFVRLSTTERQVASGPTTSRGGSETGQPTASKERESNSKRSEVTKKPPKKVIIRPRGDGKLVQLVLEKRPFALSPTGATSTWNEIAATLVDSHPKITDGRSVLGRLNVILGVFNDPSHPNHNDLTEDLRKKLASYNQIMTSFRTNLSALKKRVVYDDSSEASAEDVKISKPRTLGEGADLATVPKSPQDTVRRASRSSEVTPTNDRNIELDNGVYRRKPALPLHIEADELLLRLLLEKKPWAAADRYQQGAIWKEVADAMLDLNPRIWNGVSALGRVKWLQGVVSTPSHVDHGRVTDTLRKMLKEFEDLYNKRTLIPEQQTESAGSIQSVDSRPHDPKKRKEPVVSDASRATEDGLSSAKRIRNDAIEDTGVISDKNGQGRADEVLLREALRARPFHAKSGDGAKAWEEIAVAINQSLARPNYLTGARALTRLKRLLAVHRSSDQQSEIELSQRQRKMVDLVDTLLKVEWPSDESLLTAEHHHLQKQIRELLEDSTTPQGEEDTTPHSIPAQSMATTDRATTLAESLTDGENVNAARAVANRSVAEPETASQSAAPMELAQLRAQLTEANKQCDQLRAELTSKHESGAHARLRHEQVNALQDEVIRLRATAASDRASFESHLQSLQDEIASYREQLARQAARLDQERRDHRDELRGLVALLQSERTAHERDTAAMLSVVHREREDRREEFVAMMNLVTRSVLQTEPPAAT